jgi:hypothetical protein
MTLIDMQKSRSVFVGLALVLGATTCAIAQSDTPPASQKPAAPVIAPLPQIAVPGLAWNTLSPAQQEALAPLAAIWPMLSSAHQNKWLALVQKYPEMAEADKARLHSRMVDWTALSPKDRELARLNFAETKKLSNDARVANWEAYQALPDSKKQQLLDAAPKKPVGAAVTIKPVPNRKMAEVPVTRKTPEPVRAAVSQRAMVNRYTLLPQNPNTKDSLQAPAPLPK